MLDSLKPRSARERIVTRLSPGDDGSVVDLAAKLVVVICALNLNGVFSMALGVEQAASLVMLAACLLLIWRRGRTAGHVSFLLFVASIAGYLLLGGLATGPASTPYPPEKYYATYGATIVLTWAIVGYISSLDGPARTEFLIFTRNTFIVAAASVWVSPLLYQLYVNLPLSSEQRAGGFFANPNEAATAAVLALVLTLALPFRQLSIQAAMLLMATGAVFLTLSKTGMSLVVVLIVWHLVRNLRGPAIAVALICAAAAIATIQDPRVVLEAIAEQQYVEFDSYQKGRILAVADILGGQINETTTTRRTILWSMATERASQQVLLGNGLGTAHYMVGGLFENGEWMGAHNTILMLWGESGPVPALLFLAAIAAAVAACIKYRLWAVELTCLGVLAADLMATHSALATRYDNLVLAIVLGLISAAARARSDIAPKDADASRGVVGRA
ncbi:O-antigen ligase family protein [Devosia sp.]|uniref:O-antigen ligase family protein n=1 Tax=Devosia sp. TaxID=1871048 RepID=UPI003F6E4632